MGGIITAVNNSLTNVPIEPTLRNAELFHFCESFEPATGPRSDISLVHQRVTASMTSIDGSKTPQMFLEAILPWMLQSHLMPHIAILMASSKQSAENNVGAEKKSETSLVKSKVLGLFNNFLENDFRVVGNAAIKAILLWGHIDSLWAHMKGLKQMVNLQGGLAALTDPVLQQALVVTDYQLACYLEQDVFLQTAKEATGRIVETPTSYNSILCSPLVEYPRQFSDVRSELGLDGWTAELLDDIRFLTLSILNSDNTGKGALKVRATAEWLYKRIESFKPPSLASSSEPYIVIANIIRLAAKIYTSFVASVTPISKTLTPQLHSELHTLMASVSEKVWGSLPGIWYWILLVACPSGEKLGYESRTANEMAKWLRRKMAVAGMAIALEDFGLGTLMIQRFWLMQQWIKTETAT
ncbi:hypothetical protein DL95DRAFT_486788 [Leptodontidium sp. 2 PMI_412]|nr:hypothetical protein DL95DRAFT_486788 [Leptodontidium sp. 2 PMI_412]